VAGLHSRTRRLFIPPPPEPLTPPVFLARFSCTAPRPSRGPSRLSAA